MIKRMKQYNNTKSWQGSVFEETKAIGLYLVIPEIRDDFRHPYFKV